MKRINALILGTMGLTGAMWLTTTSCSSTADKTFANIQEVTRTISHIADGITELDAARGIEVEYRQSDSVKIEITAPEAFMQYVIVKPEENELKMTIDEKLNRSNLPEVKILVMMPSINEFKVSSGAGITVKAPYTAAGRKVEIEASSGGYMSIASIKEAFKVEIDASSGANVTASCLEATEVEIDASSGAMVTTSGECTTADIDASSGSNVDISGMMSKTCRRDSSSGATIKG